MRRWSWIPFVVLPWAGPALAGDPHVIQMPPVAHDPAQPTPPAQTGVPSIFTRADEAVAWRKNGGTFELEATVNGEALPMIFDTGASAVTLRPEDAARAGIRLSSLNYSITVRTANGASAVAPVTLRSLQVGSIVEYNVLALVARPGALPSNLLGQTFLSRLRDYQVESNRVVFHAR